MFFMSEVPMHGLRVQGVGHMLGVEGEGFRVRA